MHVEPREGESFDQFLRRFKTSMDKSARSRLEWVAGVLPVVVAVKPDDAGGDPGNVRLAHDKGGSDQAFCNRAFLVVKRSLGFVTRALPPLSAQNSFASQSRQWR